MNEKLLQVEHLAIMLKNTHQELVKGISFSLEEAEAMILLGQSGSGKTMTCRAILGLLNSSTFQVDGDILFDSKPLLRLKEKERALYYGSKIAFVPQNPMTALDPSQKIGTQMTEFLRLHRDLKKKDALSLYEQAMAQTGLSDTKRILSSRPYQLSGGMLQRCLIALAIAGKAKLVIADEPTTALDVTIQAQILELMMELKEKLGMAIIMITHDLGVVASMCDRIAVMYAGRIVEYCTTDDIFYNPKHEYTKGLLKSIPRLDAKEHERLVPIEGTPIDLLNPPAGCPFAPRCSNCMKICLREMAPVTTFDDVHYTQCWMNQKEQMEREAAK